MRTIKTAIAVLKRGEVCPRRPMPTEAYALCPIVPHVTEKGYISLPASLFEQAETLAGEMQISQSFLIEIALEELIRRRENQQLLEKINAACEVPLSEEE